MYFNCVARSCTSDYPYAFNSGANCCKTEQDGSGGALTASSTTCFNSESIDCPGSGTVCTSGKI